MVQYNDEEIILMKCSSAVTDFAVHVFISVMQFVLREKLDLLGAPAVERVVWRSVLVPNGELFVTRCGM